LDRGRTGEIKNNKCGTPMKIIKDSGSSIIVEFQDENKYQIETVYQNFKMGQIKNPYDKSIFGVGMLGVGEYGTTQSNGKLTRTYVTWHDIFVRCYYEKRKEKFPAYYGICSVSEEWHNFQNFAQWYAENYYDIGEGRMHLDKDIIKPDNTIYCPEYCIFIPQRINMLFVNKGKTNNKDLPIGVIKTQNNKFCTDYNGKYLGTYDTIEEAVHVHDIAKKNKILEVAEEYKSKLPKRVYSALCDWNYR
jgi:hypothetical protein